jgi:hypothetical protein
MSIPGHHHKVVFIGDVRKIDTDGSGAVVGVILMLDADEPCDVSIMFPAARPGVLIGNRLGVRGRLAYEPMPHRRESLYVGRAWWIDLVKRPRQAS